MEWVYSGHAVCPSHRESVVVETGTESQIWAPGDGHENVNGGENVSDDGSVDGEQGSGSADSMENENAGKNASKINLVILWFSGGQRIAHRCLVSQTRHFGYLYPFFSILFFVVLSRLLSCATCEQASK